jgi:imidazolonepropionase-like amidohydrolase
MQRVFVIFNYCFQPFKYDYMKNVVFFCIYLGLAGHSISQSSFSISVRKFIDYDSSLIVFTHCMLADVKNLKVIPNQTVIIRKGLIENLGDESHTVIPPGATIIDLSGKSLLPGFVLMHEHMYYPAYSLNPLYLQLKQLAVSFPKMYLACGATTIRTAGSIEPYSDLNLKRDIDKGKIAGPAMDVTAPYLEGVGSEFPQMHELSGPKEAKAFVDFWASQGATSFKAYNYLDKATLKAAIEAAHAKGLKVTGHLCSITYREAADLGIDQLEHGFAVATDFIAGKKENECINSPYPIYKVDVGAKEVKDLIDLLVKKHVVITSTLAVLVGNTDFQEAPRPEMLDAMSPETLEFYTKLKSKNRYSDTCYLKNGKMEKMFADAGGLLTVGTDPTGSGEVLAGYGSQLAIELLVGEGFTPIEAIRIATLNGAKAMGLEEKIGSIDIGKKADLVVIDGDVSKNIQQIEKVVLVFKNGIGFNSKRLFDSVKGEVGKH